MISGMMSLLHVLSRLMLTYLVFGISISIPHLSSLLAFLSLLHWSYMWHIDIDVLGFVWGFRQSSFTIHLMFPITRRNVVFVCASSQLEINQQVTNHVRTCTTEGVLPARLLELVQAPFVEASFQMETIKCNIQLMEQRCSILLFFFFFWLQFSLQTHYYDYAHL